MYMNVNALIVLQGCTDPDVFPIFASSVMDFASNFLATVASQVKFDRFSLELFQKMWKRCVDSIWILL